MRKFRAASEHQEGGDLPLRLQRKPDCRAGRVPVTVGLRLSKGGVVIVDQNTRLSRVLGIVTIPTSPHTDRKSGVQGKRVSVRVDHGGRRSIKQQNTSIHNKKRQTNKEPQ